MVSSYDGRGAMHVRTGGVMTFISGERTAIIVPSRTEQSALSHNCRFPACTLRSGIGYSEILRKGKNTSYNREPTVKERTSLNVGKPDVLHAYNGLPADFNRPQAVAFGELPPFSIRSTRVSRNAYSLSTAAREVII